MTHPITRPLTDPQYQADIKTLADACNSLVEACTIIGRIAGPLPPVVAVLNGVPAAARITLRSAEADRVIARLTMALEAAGVHSATVAQIARG